MKHANGGTESGVEFPLAEFNDLDLPTPLMHLQPEEWFSEVGSQFAVGKVSSEVTR